MNSVLSCRHPLAAVVALLAVCGVTAAQGPTPAAPVRVTIAALGGGKNEADVFVPAGAQPFPAIVLFAGGNGTHRKRLADKAELLRKAGHVVVLADYALLPGQAAYPGFVHNMKAAVRFARGHAMEYGIDPARIFVSGTSFGGVAAALVGTTGDVPVLEGKVGLTGVPSTVAGVIDFFGSVSFADVGDGPVETDKVKKAYKVLFNCDDPKDCEAAKKLKPEQYISAADPPFLIIHGADDKTSQQSILFAEKLKAAGVPVTLHIKKGFGHNPALIDASLAEIKAFTAKK